MKILDKTEDGNLDEQEKIKKTSQETEWELKPQYVIIALVVFVTFCCCILFFFMIYRYNGFTDFWKKLSLILQPIIIGVVIAYLLNPIMKFLEGHLFKFLEPRMKSKRKAKKTSRGIAITGSLVFLVGICVLLVAAMAAHGGERTRFSAGHRYFIDHGGLFDRRLDAVHRAAHLFRSGRAVLLMGSGDYPVGQPAGAAPAQSDGRLAVPPYQ